MENGFSEWLHHRYLDYQMENGPKTLTQFALWLEVHPATLSSWMHGVRTPRDFHIHKLASKLNGDIFEIIPLNYEDADLEDVIKYWYKVPLSVRKEVKDILAEGILRNS